MAALGDLLKEVSYECVRGTVERDITDVIYLCRMPEICRRDKGKRVADIRHTNHRHIRSLRQFYPPQSYLVQKYFRMMADAGCDTVVMEVSSQGRAHRVRSELVTVRLCTRYADKQTAFDHLSGIINNIPLRG
mgnify:CR=1 FL=1